MGNSLSSVPGIHDGKRTNPSKLSSDLYRSSTAHIHTYIPHTPNIHIPHTQYHTHHITHHTHTTQRHRHTHSTDTHTHTPHHTPVTALCPHLPAFSLRSTQSPPDWSFPLSLKRMQDTVFKVHVQCWAPWQRAVTPALWSQRQEDHKVHPSLGCTK